MFKSAFFFKRPTQSQTVAINSKSKDFALRYLIILITIKIPRSRRPELHFNEINRAP